MFVLAHPGFIGALSVAVAGWIALNLLCVWRGYMCVRALHPTKCS
jgi:hypothetical protein